MSNRRLHFILDIHGKILPFGITQEERVNKTKEIIKDLEKIVNKPKLLIEGVPRGYSAHEFLRIINKIKVNGIIKNAACEVGAPQSTIERILEEITLFYKDPVFHTIINSFPNNEGWDNIYLLLKGIGYSLGFSFVGYGMKIKFRETYHKMIMHRDNNLLKSINSTKEEDIIVFAGFLHGAVIKYLRGFSKIILYTIMDPRLVYNIVNKNGLMDYQKEFLESLKNKEIKLNENRKYYIISWN